MGNTKFKSGDRVRHLTSIYNDIGSVYLTCLTEFSDDYVSVKWDNSPKDWAFGYVCNQDDLELIDEKE